MQAAFKTIASGLGKSIRVDGVAKGIHLAAKSTFAGVTTTKQKMRVEFLADRVIKSPRVFKIEKLGPARIAHHVELLDAAGADAELITWLKQSRDAHA